ncbi:MAG: hypothetical protein II453_08485 [Alphaproteobacteria bacterium]|nr:hypothetical protein [Alphaproteobacteria bacterium]
MYNFFKKKIVPLPKMQKTIENIKRIIKTLVSFLSKTCTKFAKWYSGFSKKLTIKTKMILWEIFLVLLLVCVVIVTNKIASLASQNAAKDAVVSGDVVTEVRNDTILGRSYAVKLHRTDVQEYDYWVYTDSLYKVGDKLKQ